MSDLIEELGYKCQPSRTAQGPVVVVSVDGKEVYVARGLGRFLASDEIPGVPMTLIGEGYMRMQICI